jgi:hypothetical protein
MLFSIRKPISDKNLCCTNVPPKQETNRRFLLGEFEQLKIMEG